MLKINLSRVLSLETVIVVCVKIELAIFFHLWAVNEGWYAIYDEEELLTVN